MHFANTELMTEIRVSIIPPVSLCQYRQPMHLFSFIIGQGKADVKCWCVQRLKSCGYVKRSEQKEVDSLLGEEDIQHLLAFSSSHYYSYPVHFPIKTFPSVCDYATSLQLCPTLCDSMDCSLPGFSVHGIFQARIWSRLSCPPPGDLPLGFQTNELICWSWWDLQYILRGDKFYEYKS